jgi:Major Vault Protein Repeat domain
VHLVPQGEALQIYDSGTGSLRVVVGPSLAKLEPNEVVLFIILFLCYCIIYYFIISLF